jgi:hypothetical protein
MYNPKDVAGGGDISHCQANGSVREPEDTSYRCCRRGQLGLCRYNDKAAGQRSDANSTDVQARQCLEWKEVADWSPICKRYSTQ